MFCDIQELDNEILIKFIYDDKSYISGTIYLIYNELYINYFHVDIKNRGNGIGTNLLNQIINHSKNNYDIKTVHLVDESERYKLTNNIYIKYGFNYIDGKKMLYNI